MAVGDSDVEGYNKIYECDKNPYFRGIQYMKDEDPQVVLLFDVNGYIAGIQSGIPNNLYNGYPHLNLQPPFIQDGDLFKLTAYFTDPSTICTFFNSIRFCLWKISEQFESKFKRVPFNT
jgi:charged multivesicular body protein 7